MTLKKFLKKSIKWITILYKLFPNHLIHSLDFPGPQETFERQNRNLRMQAEHARESSWLWWVLFQDRVFLKLVAILLPQPTECWD